MQKGSAKFHGIILALGDGSVGRGGPPDIAGAPVVATFAHSRGGFAAPNLNVKGGGNSLVGYNSEWVRKAMESLGSRVVGIVKK